MTFVNSSGNWEPADIAFSGVVLTDGSEALTADWDAGSFQIRAETFYSDAATGTPPFTVASSTKVANLNVDLLDGYNSSQFAILVGQSGGQTLYGGTGASENLTLRSTTNATVGVIDCVDQVSSSKSLAPTTISTSVANTDAKYILYNNSSANWAGLGADNGGTAWLRTGISSGAILVFTAGGSLGVGVASPSYTCDINGACHASSFPTSSDRRLKTNVRPIAGALDLLDGLQGVRFEWSEQYAAAGRHGPAGDQIGLIAQEVEARCPELITTWPGADGQRYRALDYGRLVPVLVSALNELAARVAQLEARKK